MLMHVSMQFHHTLQNKLLILITTVSQEHATGKSTGQIFPCPPFLLAPLPNIHYHLYQLMSLFNKGKLTSSDCKMEIFDSCNIFFRGEGRVDGVIPMRDWGCFMRVDEHVFEVKEMQQEKHE